MNAWEVKQLRNELQARRNTRFVVGGGVKYGRLSVGIGVFECRCSCFFFFQCFIAAGRVSSLDEFLPCLGMFFV